MALRSFRDSSSVEWRVWDVRPSGAPTTERRARERRSPDPILHYSGPERRAGGDRRIAPNTRWVIPIREWLAFDCEAEKRRLIPVPNGWEELPDSELESLCTRAVPVQKLLPD